ncbi:hypothetical protein [Streptomyces viridochromogenes]|nr:hypothetical protein [Streptomyces viridochromogenes]
MDVVPVLMPPARWLLTEERRESPAQLIELAVVEAGHPCFFAALLA